MDRNGGATGSISHFIGYDLLQISDDNEERLDKSDFICSNSQSFMEGSFRVINGSTDSKFMILKFQMRLVK